MEKNATIAFVRQITSEKFPAELEAFDLFADDCFNKISGGEHPDDLYRNSGGHNEFSWEAVEHGVQSLSVLAGTVLTFLTIRKEWKASKSNKFERLKDTWQLDLIKSGIPPEIAAVIVEKYQEDLKNLIK